MKKSVSTLKRAAAFVLCAAMCLSLLPVSAATSEISSNILTNTDVTSTTTIAETAGTANKYYFATDKQATDNNNKVTGFSKNMTQVKPTIEVETGTTDNYVISMGYDTTGDAMTTTSSNVYYGRNTSDAVSKLQVWEIDVKLPDVDGTTRLFHYGANNDWWMSRYDEFSAVAISGAKVKLISTTNVSSQSYGVDVLPEDVSLQPETWYKIRRVMDLQALPHKQKVYVYEKNSNGEFSLIGSTDDWKNASVSTSQNYAATHNDLRAWAFFVKGYSGNVLLDNLAVYQSQYKLDDISVGETENKVGMLNATTSSALALGAQATWTQSLEHNYSMRLNLPVVSNGSVVKLFSLSDDRSSNGPSMTFNKPVITIKGETNSATGGVDAKVYSRTLEDSSYVETPVTDKNGNQIVLEANEWYTFDIHGYLNTYTTSSDSIVKIPADSAGDYTIKITKGNEVLTGSVDDDYADVTLETYAKVGWGQYHVLGLISASGIPTPLYFDDVYAATTNLAGDIRTLDYDFDTDENINSGDALADVISMKDRTNYVFACNKSTAVNSSNAYVVSDITETYLDGTVTSMELEPLNIKFSAAIDEDTFNKTNVVFSAKGKTDDDYAVATDGYDVSYDSTTNTGTISFNALEYETDYILEIKTGICSAEYGLPLTFSYAYSFSTPADNFTIGNPKFETTTDGTAYTEVADLTTAFSAGTKVRAKVEMTNESLEERDYLVICVAFSDDNEMLDIKVSEGTINVSTALTGDDAVTTDTLTITEANTRVEIYVWDNWTKIIPKIDKVVAPTQTAN